MGVRFWWSRHQYLLGVMSGLATFNVNGDSINGGGGIFSLFSSSQLGRFWFGLFVFEGPCSNSTRFPWPRALCNWFPWPRALCNLLTRPDLNPFHKKKYNIWNRIWYFFFYAESKRCNFRSYFWSVKIRTLIEQPSVFTFIQN